jgi:hypothetical protein
MHAFGQWGQPPKIGQVVNNHINHTTLHWAKKVMVKVWDVDGLIDDQVVGGPELKYLSSTPFFPIFGLTTVLKILSFQALALGDNIADLLQLWHQQPVLQIVTLAHSPACSSGSSADMLRQSHWKTQIEGLTERQFVPFSVHRARVCIQGTRWDQCHVPP